MASKGVTRLNSEFRTDKLVNELSNLGSEIDKSTRNRVKKTRRLTYEEREELFETNGYASRIVQLPPNDCTRNGWKYQFESQPEGDSSGLLDELKRKESAIDLKSKLRKADVWSRLYGGSIVVLNVDDGKPANQPIDDLSDIQDIVSAKVYSRKNVQIEKVKTSGEGRGDPLIFQIDQHALSDRANEDEFIHRDRVLFFSGDGTPTDQQNEVDAWGVDTLTRIWNQLSNFSMADNALGHSIHEANQGIWKLRGLAEKFEGPQDGKQRVIDRISSINMSQSMLNMMLMDLDREDYEEINRNVEGMAELHERLARSLAAVSGIPVVMLMGESPGGLGTDDKAGARNWNKKISARQSDVYEDKLKRFANLYTSARLGREHDVQYKVVFNDLYEVADLQKSETQLNQAKRVQRLIEADIIDRDEARQMAGVTQEVDTNDTREEEPTAS